MGVIYLRTCLTNGKQYVGQTIDFKNREHQWKLLKWRYANQSLTEDRNKYGLDNFKTEILEECDNSKLDELERYYIEKFNTVYPNGYNTNEGGTINFKHSSETKKKMSEIAKSKKHTFKKGHNPWNRGIKMSEEFSKKCSSAKKGCKGFFKGKHHSEESKKKMSDAKKGKQNTSLSKIVYKYNSEGKLIDKYPTTQIAGKENNCSQSLISLACNDGKIHKGYKWSYEPL